ncbi:MAG: hypothetical protein ACP5OG_00935 [Candidatus Nanoarchaeia archaeon]
MQKNLRKGILRIIVPTTLALGASSLSSCRQVRATMALDSFFERNPVLEALALENKDSGLKNAYNRIDSSYLSSKQKKDLKDTYYYIYRAKESDDEKLFLSLPYNEKLPLIDKEIIESSSNSNIIDSSNLSYLDWRVLYKLTEEKLKKESKRKK